MNESYIKNKVFEIMGFKDKKEQISRMARDREIARIGNLISHQVDILNEEHKRKVCSAVHHILKDELK